MLGAVGCVSSGQIYVSRDGNDAWSGKLKAPNSKRSDGPFATLERARDEVRRMKRERGALAWRGVGVQIREGTYELSRAFTLGVEDSGTAEAPIVYRAFRGEEVRLSGGREISGFRINVDPETRDWLPPGDREKVLEVDLKALGITDYGEMTRRGFGPGIHRAGLELFFQDRPMTLARWPNEGWTTIVGVPDGLTGGKFSFDSDRGERWAAEKDAWVHGFWTWDWADSYEKIKAIDVGKRQIETVPPHGSYGYTKGKRFYVVNALRELDTPGEWYLDRDAGRLYFWPPGGIGEGSATVSITPTLIEMKDVSHVTIEGLRLECVRGDGIVVQRGEHNRISNCVLKNIGNHGAVIQGGICNVIESCDIEDTGDGGIVLAAGDRKTLTPGNCEAVNNHIRHYSRWSLTYTPGVMISGVGNRVAHNLIHDAPHNAIQLSGNEHVIEYNEVHHVCQDTDDVGAFYMGRDWTERGNVVRFNYFHHLGKEGSGIGAMAIYLDDWASGTTVYGNLCYMAGRAVLIGGGRDNTVENNVFVDCTPAVHVDSRGLGWAKYYFDGKDKTLFDRLEAMNYKQPPYSVRYPALLTLLGDEPAVAKGNRIVRNISTGGRWLDLLDKLDEKTVDVRDNFTSGDPGFRSAEELDFGLWPDAPAREKGFKELPIGMMGLRRRGNEDGSGRIRVIE